MNKVQKVRDWCLVDLNTQKNLSLSSPKQLLLAKFSDLMKKVWNPKNFKGHVSPHELLQAISEASNKRFKIGE